MIFISGWNIRPIVNSTAQSDHSYGCCIVFRSLDLTPPISSLAVRKLTPTENRKAKFPKTIERARRERAVRRRVRRSVFITRPSLRSA